MRRVLCTLFVLATALGGASFVDAARPATAQVAGPGVSTDEAARGLVYDGLEPPGPDSPCRGLLELAGRDRFAGGRERCTHGPDPAPPGVDVRQPRPPLAGSRAAAEKVPCYGTGSDGFRVQLIYAATAGGPDRFAAYAASFATWAAGMDKVANDSAAETGGVRHIRFVTDTACNAVIDRVTLTPAAMASFDTSISELQAKGYTRSDRKYVVWADTSKYCGIGLLYTDDDANPTPGANANNGNPGIPGLVARIDNGCWGQTNLVEAHELLHTLGGVQPSAPNATTGAHCVDESDRMCYADGSLPFRPIVQVCPLAHEALFDCNHDDYFSTAPPFGSYLATHWNTASSAFLTSAAPGVPPTTTTTMPPTTTSTSTTTTVPACPSPGSGPPGGQTAVSASTVSRGSRIGVHGAFLQAGKCGWQLRYRGPGESGTCHSGQILNSVGVTSNSFGETPDSIGTIPAASLTGTAQLCLATAGDAGYRSTPVNVTVT